MNIDLFDGDFKSRNRGHFAAIVRAAYSDGKISEQEQQFIDNLAIKLEISDEDYKEILKDPNKYPVNPPYLQDQRIERLYDLSRMVYLHHHLGPEQKQLLRRFIAALGFSGDLKALTNQALAQLVLEADYDTFKENIEAFLKKTKAHEE